MNYLLMVWGAHRNSLFYLWPAEKDGKSPGEQYIILRFTSGQIAPSFSGRCPIRFALNANK